MSVIRTNIFHHLQIKRVLNSIPNKLLNLLNLNHRKLKILDKLKYDGVDVSYAFAYDPAIIANNETFKSFFIQGNTLRKQYNNFQRIQKDLYKQVLFHHISINKYHYF